MDSGEWSQCRSTGIHPGAIMFTVMPDPASSRAVLKASPVCPPLAATYALNGADASASTSLVI